MLSLPTPPERVEVVKAAAVLTTKVSLPEPPTILLPWALTVSVKASLPAPKSTVEP